MNGFKICSLSVLLACLTTLVQAQDQEKLPALEVEYQPATVQRSLLGEAENPVEKLPSSQVVPERQPDRQPSENPLPQVVQPPRQGMTFMDSRLFDSQLSKELDAGKESVEVDVLGKMSLSALPDRLDKWITRVGETGSVEVRENNTRTRNFFGLIPMIFSGFKALSEERTLGPAKNYDMSILYRRDASGDTLIERIVFKRKKPQ